MSWWNDERTEAAKRLWLEGKSASEIYRTINAPSRNAVIAKVHRLGLSGRDQAGRAAAAAPTRSTTAAPRRGAPKVVAPTEVAPALAGRVAVLQRAHVPADRGPREVQPLPALRHVGVEGEGALLAHLDDRRCRWPIAGPGTDRPLAADEEMRFCGCRPAPGRIYCAPHASLAYQPVATRVGRTPRAELERSLRRYL